MNSIIQLFCIRSLAGIHPAVFRNFPVSGYDGFPMDFWGNTLLVYPALCVPVCGTYWCSSYFRQGACTQVIFVQTFSATFYQSDVSRRQDSLNTDTHLCFKVIADDVLFGLCNTYGTVSKYDFVGACIDHGRVCHERSLAGQYFYGKLGKDRLQVTFTSGNDTVIVQ